jgi:O-antigen/teichoic acid export membrane protein
MIGLPQSVYYFIPKSDAETRKRFLRQTLDIFTILGLVCSLVLLFFRGSLANMFHNPHLNKVLIIYAFYPFFMFLSQLYYCVMIGLQQPRKAAVFIIFSVFCDLVLILGLALLTRNLNFIIMGMVISVVIQWIYARLSLQPLTSQGRLFEFNAEMLKAQFMYSLPIGVATIVGVVSAQIDKLVISSYFTPEVFAVFSVGAAELPFIAIITNSVNAVILPEMSKTCNPDCISDLYRSAVRKNALILFPIFTFCFVFAPHIISILYSAKYLDAVSFFRIYLLTMPLRIATYGLLFQVFNKTRFIFVTSLIALTLNTGLSILFINLIGIKGPAISTMSVTYITVIIYLFLIKSKLKLRLSKLFPLVQLIRTTLASIICASLCIPILYIPVNRLWQFLIGGVLYVILFYIIGFWFGAVLHYDRQMLQTVFNGSIRKLRGLINV